MEHAAPQATDGDRRFFERELAAFLPDRIFDAHAHLWRTEWVPWSVGDTPEDLGYGRYMEAVEQLHPDRTTKGLFIPFVTADHKDEALEASEWVAGEIAADSACRGLFFVKPEDDPEWVRDQVSRLGLQGLKCYYTMASDPSWEAPIPDFLPAPLVQVAHEEGWVITLHMVK